MHGKLETHGLDAFETLEIDFYQHLTVGQAAVSANGQALYFAPRCFQVDPALIRLSHDFKGASEAFYPFSLRRDAEMLKKHGVPVERLGGAVHAAAAGNRILFEWERLERLSLKALHDECSMRGLIFSECLEWYGVDFLKLRLKKLILLEDRSLLHHWSTEAMSFFCTLASSTIQHKHTTHSTQTHTLQYTQIFTQHIYHS